jgi:teichuronic acid biosynthesis glycosyltransferase TuaH
LISKSLILISLEVWDDIWRRNQFLAREFASRGWDVSFVGPARDISYALRSGDFYRCFGGISTPKDITRIKASRPVKLAPESISLGRRINASLLTGHLRSRYRLHQWKTLPVIWVNDHNSFSAIQSLERSCLIYDITDDWTTFVQNKAARDRVVASDRWLCENSDAVIVCSERLYEAKKAMVSPDRLFLVPNGVDIEHYADCSKRSFDVYESRSNPVFGYTGSIHDQRLDVALVEAIARRMTTGVLRFIGPDMLEPSSRQRLLNTGRVELLGPIPYQDLPKAMQEMDAMIVPHLVTPFTESLNPLKLWEYLASGKPVVSTPVAGFRDYPQLIKLASSADEFYQAMLKSLNEPMELATQRQSAVAGHSWGARADQIEKIIEFAIHHPRCLKQ